MFNNKKRMIGIAVAIVVVVGLAMIPIQFAMQAAKQATEQPVGGADVLVSEYCETTEKTAASGAAVANAVTGGAVQTPATESAVQAEVTPAPTMKPEHVELNLNYSRLGIANKVDTYLNVRKKPSTSGKIVGKMTKNAGCHIYKIKKGWAKMVSGEVNGWVKASYLTTDKKAEELATEVGRDCVEIQADSLRVRALPTTDAPIYSIVSIGEEFVIKKRNLTLDFIKKVIKKEKISKEFIERAGGYTAIEQSMADFICIYVDDEYAFVAKEYVKEQYSLKRAVKVKTVSASQSEGVSSSQASIAEYAKQFLGNPYVWGGTSLTNGADCSGFVMALYQRYGYYLPHNAAAQSGVTRSVSSPKPGDLFFYSNGSRINHVAMYIGGGMVIHASNERDGIKISNAYYRHPVKIGRVMN